MSLINIALSGLNANRVALDVTAQNVANVNTQGYSRQQALMASVEGGKYDRLSPGTGVEVSSIRRVTDEYLVKQMWTTNSFSSYASRFTTNMSHLENTLSADGLNLSAGFDAMFASLNDATVKPESIPYRQQIINEAEALGLRFNTLSESLSSQLQNVDDQRNAAIDHANTLLSNIADINQQVIELQGTGGNPATLLDKRELLIGELSNFIEVKTTTQENGGIQVMLASGQPLVMGGDHGQLQATPDPSGSNLPTLEVVFGTQSFIVANVQGGELGALNDYQRDVLQPYRSAIDDMAQAFADEFNTVLATGTDLNGNPGTPLFSYDPASPASSLTVTDIEPKQLAFSSDGNPGNADVLTDLIALSNQPVNVSGFGTLTLNDAYSAMIGEVAIKARQADADYQAKSAMNQQAISARDNVSAVNSDEEAANLMTFANAHNANMKVISTANQLFDSVLQLF